MFSTVLYRHSSPFPTTSPRPTYPSKYSSAGGTSTPTPPVPVNSLRHGSRSTTTSSGRPLERRSILATRGPVAAAAAEPAPAPPPLKRRASWLYTGSNSSHGSHRQVVPEQQSPEVCSSSSTGTPARRTSALNAERTTTTGAPSADGSASSAAERVSGTAALPPPRRTASAKLRTASASTAGLAAGCGGSTPRSRLDLGLSCCGGDEGGKSAGGGTLPSSWRPGKLGLAPTESISSAASASCGSRYTATTPPSCAPSCALEAALSPAVSARRAASKVLRGAAIHTTGRPALARWTWAIRRPQRRRLRLGWAQPQRRERAVQGLRVAARVRRLGWLAVVGARVAGERAGLGVAQGEEVEAHRVAHIERRVGEAAVQYARLVNEKRAGPQPLGVKRQPRGRVPPRARVAEAAAVERACLRPGAQLGLEGRQVMLVPRVRVRHELDGAEIAGDVVEVEVHCGTGQGTA
eukprot:scaffold115048_cov69-Phaeocystis_antarctica.AAC.4